MFAVWSTTLLFAHVPTYGGCVDNCCKPPHAPDVSQVVYLKGSGGLELHLEDITEYDVLDVDVVLRDDVNMSSYDLYIGCGGCVPQDPIVVSPVPLSEYGPVEIEPFTQTAYRSVLTKTQRKFDTKQLRNCTEGHFTIRLVDSSSSPVVWGAVVGLKEQFTFEELLLFPVYVLRNHGTMWNDIGWTYWVWLFFGAPLFLILGRGLCRRICNCYVPGLYDGVDEVKSFRDVFYEVATIGFLAASLEMLTHLLYAQSNSHASIGWGFGVGMGIVIITSAIPLAFVYVVWYLQRRPNRCSSWASSPYWAPLEIATGFSFLLLLGAGFYVGPVAIMLAGMVRIFEACSSEPSQQSIVVKEVHPSNNQGLTQATIVVLERQMELQPQREKVDRRRRV